jgi:uncharacterized protein with HEPN domain
MSSATPSPFERDYRVYLEDMLEFSESVIAYTAGQSFEAWAADGMRLDATLRKLSLIGEAASRVPPAIRDKAPDIPWRKIVGARNRLMHAYPSTDLSAIWSIVSIDVPALRTDLQALLPQL